MRPTGPTTCPAPSRTGLPLAASDPSVRSNCPLPLLPLTEQHLNLPHACRGERHCARACSEVDVRSRIPLPHPVQWQPLPNLGHLVIPSPIARKPSSRLQSKPRAAGVGQRQVAPLWADAVKNSCLALSLRLLSVRLLTLPLSSPLSLFPSPPPSLSLFPHPSPSISLCRRTSANTSADAVSSWLIMGLTAAMMSYGFYGVYQGNR